MYKVKIAVQFSCFRSSLANWCIKSWFCVFWRSYLYWAVLCVLKIIFILSCFVCSEDYIYIELFCVFWRSYLYWAVLCVLKIIFILSCFVCSEDHIYIELFCVFWWSYLYWAVLFRVLSLLVVRSVRLSSGPYDVSESMRDNPKENVWRELLYEIFAENASKGNISRHICFSTNWRQCKRKVTTIVFWRNETQTHFSSKV
jgi:hypothetical protein